MHRFTGDNIERGPNQSGGGARRVLWGFGGDVRWAAETSRIMPEWMRPNDGEWWPSEEGGNYTYRLVGGVIYKRPRGRGVKIYTHLNQIRDRLDGV